MRLDSVYLPTDRNRHTGRADGIAPSIIDDVSLAGLASLNIIDISTTPAESMLNEELSGSMTPPRPNRTVAANEFLDIWTDYEGKFLHPREVPPLPELPVPPQEKVLSTSGLESSTLTEPNSKIAFGYLFESEIDEKDQGHRPQQSIPQLQAHKPSHNTKSSGLSTQRIRHKTGREDLQLSDVDYKARRERRQRAYARAVLAEVQRETKAMAATGRIKESKPSYRSASAPLDEMLALGTANSKSALKAQQPSVKVLLRSFDLDSEQSSSASRKPPVPKSMTENDESGFGLPKSRATFENEVPASQSKAGLMTNNTGLGRATQGYSDTDLQLEEMAAKYIQFTSSPLVPAALPLPHFEARDFEPPIDSFSQEGSKSLKMIEVWMADIQPYSAKLTAQLNIMAGENSNNVIHDGAGQNSGSAISLISAKQSDGETERVKKRQGFVVEKGQGLVAEKVQGFLAEKKKENASFHWMESYWG